MKPPWVEFPTAHPISINWRMGAGEAYLSQFYAWWTEADASASEESRLDYIKSWPMPAAWTHIAIEMIWPDLDTEDGEIFFDEDKAEPRRIYFDRAVAAGLPSEAAWQADFDDPEWA